MKIDEMMCKLNQTCGNMFTAKADGEQTIVYFKHPGVNEVVATIDNRFKGLYHIYESGSQGNNTQVKTAIKEFAYTPVEDRGNLKDYVVPDRISDPNFPVYNKQVRLSDKIYYASCELLSDPLIILVLLLIAAMVSMCIMGFMGTMN